MALICGILDCHDSIEVISSKLQASKINVKTFNVYESHDWSIASLFQKFGSVTALGASPVKLLLFVETTVFPIVGATEV